MEMFVSVARLVRISSCKKDEKDDMRNYELRFTCWGRLMYKVVAVTFKVLM